MTDAIDFSTVAILNSPDVSAWPITSEITALGLRSTSLHLEHTRQGLWPAVRFGDALQESTLWIFVRLGATWCGAGVERIRPGQIDKPENTPSHERDDWFYDPARWPQMVDHQPQPGELVGFMVAAGDTRGFGNVAVRERSAIVLVEFPTDAGRDYPPFASLAPAPPAPVPPAPPEPGPVPDSDADVIAFFERVVTVVEANTVALLAVRDRLDALQSAGIRVHL